MTWNPLDAPVDFVLLGGVRSPGLASLEGADSPRKWDQRKATATTGATLVFKGIDLSKFRLLLRLYTAEHWGTYITDFQPLLQRPPSGQRPRALDIEHPFLEALGIRSVVVGNVKQPTQTGDGEYTIEVELLEFRAPVRAIARPDGSVNQPATPTDPEDQFNEFLLGVFLQERAG